jgi:hypothetical protein
MKFGSHLYGTATPESDTDFKGVALPTREQVLLGRIPKHAEMCSTGASHCKNTKDDVDTEVFILHQFIKLALEGQTVALDMLHAPAEMLTRSTPLWREIVLHRKRFYSKNVHSFIGYAMGQAAKYGVKGSRLNAAQQVYDWLAAQDPGARLSECNFGDFPCGEHIDFLGNPINTVDVCGRKIQTTVRTGYARDVVGHFLDNYGERARQAARDEGIDWKALSHAFRAAYQMRELFTAGTITFPRPEAEFLTKVKTGQLRYLEIAPVLEDLIDEVKELKEQSRLPEKPDVGFWERLLIGAVEENVL